jgi:hypothetical protein
VRPYEREHGFGAGRSRTLQALLKTVLAPYRDGPGGERIRMAGDDPPIGPSAATALALAVHEFATNAVKYGALSAPNGTVDIACATAGDMLELTWTERGGPAIESPPEQEGFGAMLAQRRRRPPRNHCDGLGARGLDHPPGSPDRAARSIACARAQPRVPSLMGAW